MTVTASESILSSWAALGELSAGLAQGVPRLEAQGLWGSSSALVVAALIGDSGRPALYVSPGTAERHRAAEDLRFFWKTLKPATARVLEFPPAEPAGWRGPTRSSRDERCPRR